MKLWPKRNLLLLALALCLVFSVISAETLIAVNLAHDCADPGCRPCLRIEIARSFLKTLMLAGLALFIIACLAFTALICKNYRGLGAWLPASPILLKVRLNS